MNVGPGTLWDVKQTPPGPQILPAGATLRFAVGSTAGPRSNTWSVIGSKNNGDFYIGARQVLGMAKLSLHVSGRWRRAMTAEEAAKRMVAESEDRVMNRWEPPTPIGDGWVHAATIAVPSSSLRSGLSPEAKPRKGTVSFWNVEPGRYEVRFSVLIASASAPPLNAHNVIEAVGQIQSPSGGCVWVVGSEFIISDEYEAYLAELRRISRELSIEQEGLDAFLERQNPTGAGWGSDSEGRPVVIDLGDLSFPGSCRVNRGRLRHQLVTPATFYLAVSAETSESILPRWETMTYDLRVPYK